MAIVLVSWIGLSLVFCLALMRAAARREQPYREHMAALQAQTPVVDSLSTRSEQQRAGMPAVCSVSY